MLKQMDGIRAGRCYDGHPGSLQPGGPVQVYPCVHQWYQFVSFGDGEHAPLGSIYSTIPSHVVKQISNLGHAQIPFMCFGVYGRSEEDELDWDDKNYKNGEANSYKDVTHKADEEEDVSPLAEWIDEEIVTTQCTNAKAVVDWVFVPYVVEEEDGDEGEEDSTWSSGEPKGTATENHDEF